MKISCQEILILSTIVCIITSCSSSSKETKVEIKQNQDTSYVFDNVPPEDIYKLEPPSKPTIITYIIQIGAFSTLENAKEFADFSRKNLNKDIKVEYKANKKMYVVQIYPPFDSKRQAEGYRNQLRYFEEYKDAWIISIEGKSK